MGPKLRSVTTPITEQQVLQLATGKKKPWSVPCAKKGVLATALSQASITTVMQAGKMPLGSVSLEAGTRISPKFLNL